MERLGQFVLHVCAALVIVATVASPRQAKGVEVIYGSEQYFKGNCGTECSDQVSFKIFDSGGVGVGQSVTGAPNTWLTLLFNVDPGAGYQVKCACPQKGYDHVVQNNIAVKPFIEVTRVWGNYCIESDTAYILVEGNIGPDGSLGYTLWWQGGDHPPIVSPPAPAIVGTNGRWEEWLEAEDSLLAPFANTIFDATYTVGGQTSTDQGSCLLESGCVHW